MPTITRLHPNRLSVLYDQLLAALPALGGGALRLEGASGIRRVKVTDPLPPGATLDPTDPAYMLLPAEDPDTIHLDWPDAAGVTIAQVDAIITAHDPNAPTEGEQLRQQILTLAQSAVGVSLDALTAGQRNSLIAILLWKAGGVTPQMTVAPLGQWAG